MQLEKIINIWFAPVHGLVSTKGLEVVNLTSTEIRHELIELSGGFSDSTNKIGMAMRRLGFRQKGVRDGAMSCKKWIVVRINRPGQFNEHKLQEYYLGENTANVDMESVKHVIKTLFSPNEKSRLNLTSTEIRDEVADYMGVEKEKVTLNAVGASLRELAFVKKSVRSGSSTYKTWFLDRKPFNVRVH